MPVCHVIARRAKLSPKNFEAPSFGALVCSTPPLLDKELEKTVDQTSSWWEPTSSPGNIAAMAPFEIPQVTQADILGFQETHFSLHAIASFDSQFLQPLGHEAEKYQDGNETADYIDEDDDGLGYYADGVKRTLTDEQIAIFRHSELEALKRAARGTASQRRSSPAETGQLADAKDLEDGEVLGPATDADTSSSSKKRKNRKKAAKNRRTEEKKPDLRKRTWDVVDSGLESLDYDEMESAPKMRVNPSQRRQISYDDG